jgi:hypothetical protein
MKNVLAGSDPVEGVGCLLSPAPQADFMHELLALCRNSTRKSFGFSIADTVILSPGFFGTKDLHLPWSLKTHADPSSAAADSG